MSGIAVGYLVPAIGVPEAAMTRITQSDWEFHLAPDSAGDSNCVIELLIWSLEDRSLPDPRPNSSSPSAGELTVWRRTQTRQEGGAAKRLVSNCDHARIMI
jgi:hypothetical protein